MKIITLTTQSGNSVHVVVEQIGFVIEGENGVGCKIAMAAHNNGGLPVKESALKVTKMMREACANS